MRTSRDRRLQFRIEHLDHAAPSAPRLSQAKPRSPISSPSRFSRRRLLVAVVLGEFDQQHRLGLAAHELFHRRPEHGDVARQLDHGAVDQFHRDRPQLHDVLGGVHRLVEAAEMARRRRARVPSSGQSFNSISVENASVPSEPTSNARG